MSALPLLVLLGRPNVGKSSLFNRLSGAHAHVGNFPGITVDILEATLSLSERTQATLVDLPGVYTLQTQFTPGTDEQITRDFLLGHRSHPSLLLVQVIDATQLALGLRLTQEIHHVAPGANLLVVINQYDQLQKEGFDLNVRSLENALGVPIVLTNARDSTAKASLFRALEHALTHSSTLLTPSWTADHLTSQALHRTSEKKSSRTEQIDAILLHPIVGPLLFVLLMATVFAAVFLIADPITKLCDHAVQLLASMLRPFLKSDLLASLVIDGVLGGAGTVVAFLPQIIILIGAIELLESTGYLSRAAFLVDRVLRISRLGGKAFVPLLAAHACAVPAIAATRVLRDPKERLTTILVIPLMTCSARLPVYSLIITTFFGGGALCKALVCTALYFFAIVSGLVASVILRRTAVRGRGLPLVLEMPSYRMPLWSSVLTRCIREAKDFLRRVGTFILAASLLLWILMHLEAPWHASNLSSTPIERSVAAAIGQSLEPATRPLGFDWRINVGLIGSLGQRELMIGTLGVIFGVEDSGDDTTSLTQKIQSAKLPDGRPRYTIATALSLLVFFVFACQCVSTLAAVHRETKSWRWTGFVFVYTYAIAYGMAAITFQAARLVY